MHAGLDGLTFKVFSTSDLSGEIANHVSLFLYRVDVDRTRRHAELPRIDRQAPERFALALELHYPLTVWSGGTAEREQEILSDSMEILDEHALLSGDLLDSNFPWEEGSEIKVCLESMTNEDMLRLWGLIRTRLSPVCAIFGANTITAAFRKIIYWDCGESNQCLDTGDTAMNMVSFANRFSPDSSVVLGVLGLKVVRYVNEGNSRQATVIPNLRIRSTRSNDIPIYHVSTGLYGFLKLKPGTHRLHITDPQNRYLPRAISIIDVPDHNSVRRMLENGITPPDNATAPLYKTVLLRPGQDYPLPPGETALWGRILSNAGVPTVYTRIEVTTQHNLTATKVITYADQNGIYFARLPGERAKFAEPAEPSPEGERVGPPDDSSQSPEGELTKTFDRSIAVYTLKKDQAFETDPLNRFPADFDDLNPEDALGPYQPAQFRLINPVSQEQRNANDGNPPQPTIIVGKRTRWDIVIV